MIDGCFSPDEDFDGQSYRLDWPGTNPNPFVDRQLHPTPVLFTSPVTGFGQELLDDRVRDRPARPREQHRQDSPPFCNQNTGANCVIPPDGAPFYPFFTSTIHDGTCTWQEGGNFIPGTINHFGGSAKTEFGQLLQRRSRSRAPRLHDLDPVRGLQQRRPAQRLPSRARVPLVARTWSQAHGRAWDTLIGNIGAVPAAPMSPIRTPTPSSATPS